jgi:hypothetical protein
MKSAWRVCFGVPFVLATSAAIVHCGSSDAGSDILDSSEAGVEGGSSGDGSSSPADGGADSATNPRLDGSTSNEGAAPVPEGGVAADPGKVACGASSCDITTSFCCAVPDGGSSCQTSGGACSALGGARQECNEAADCPAVDGGKQVCCFDLNDGSLLATSCRLDCNGGGGQRFQACRTTTECLSGTCEVRACNAGAGAASIESCKPIPDLCP